MIKQIVVFSKEMGIRLRWALIILALTVGAVLFEGIGVGMFLPILELMNNSGEAEQLSKQGAVWNVVMLTLNRFDLSPHLGTFLVIAFICLLCRQFFTYVRQTFVAEIQYRIIRDVRVRSFDRLLHAKLALHDRLHAGDFVNEMLTETAKATSCLSAFVNYWSLMLLCIAYAGFLFVLSQEMTAAAAVVTIACGLILKRLMSRTRPLGAKILEMNQAVSRFLLERIPSIRLVRLSDMEKVERQNINTLLDVQFTRSMDMMRLKALLSVLVEPVIVAFAFVLLFTAVTVYDVPIAQVLVFFLVLLRLLPVVKEAMLARQSALSFLPSLQVVKERLQDLESEAERHAGTLTFMPLRRGIRFENVSFSYQGTGSHEAARSALDHVNIEIPAGRMMAIVGPSGSGKSTLVDLLPRLRRPDEGRILFDDTPHELFDIGSLRHAIAYAPQMPYLFDSTPAEHIRYGNPEASDSEVEHAAKVARAHEFIARLPQGYATRLGPSGGQLSGGQRQRLDLARALVKQAPILILDEPTSQLDAESETLFRDALDDIRRRGDTTILLIGHRLSTVTVADQIAVLRNGRVCELGTHAELLARGGWYASAYSSQSGSQSGGFSTMTSVAAV